jgi:hypothetical protein
MIAVITDPGIGGTFLSWSIYYLSGRTSYFSARKDKFVEVCHNPLTDKNAHNFLPNQPRNTDDFASIFHKTLANNEHLYMHQFKHGTKDAVAKVCKYAEKIIILALSPSHVLYQCSYTPRADVIPSMNSEKKLTDPDSIHEDLVDYFFRESKQIWKTAGLNDIWDKREFIALNFDPFDHSSILNYVDPNVNKYYQIDAHDAWLNLDQHINELFLYLNMPVDQNRFENWMSVYGVWKNNHTKRLNFVNNFEIIINNIINGVDMDLSRFEFDLIQEAAIQHQIMYKHNLNFKTWQLEKFINTKQLHNLLEPNIHDLSKSLIKRLTA